MGYTIPVGDIVSDADELVRRLNEKEAQVPYLIRRTWRVIRPLQQMMNVQPNLYQNQFQNPLQHQGGGTPA
jgi:hypothetical protein